MKIKCAAFKSMTGDYTSVFEDYRGDESYAPTGFVRVSQFVEVDFPELPAADQAAAELAQLDEMETNIRADFDKKIRALMERRANIAALSYSPASVVREHESTVLQ